MGGPRGLSYLLLFLLLASILVGATAAAGQAQRATGYLPPEFELPFVKPQAPRAAPLTPLPASFDWREQGLVSGVGDQGSCGACYAFAGLENFQSKIYLDGGGVFDFSENNIKECEPNQYRCVGGNYWIVSNHLSTRGTVLDACDPYYQSVVGCNTTCPTIKTLREWRVISEAWIPEPDILKAHILEYGPIFSAINSGHGDYWYNEFTNYDGSYTLFYEGTGNVNHAVTIVGWDDSLSHAGGQGAWIVKNSWGPAWGGPCGYGTGGGYFTIAYGSAKIGQATSYAYEWQDYNPNEGLLYYDEAGVTYYYGYPPNLHAWGMCKYVPPEDVLIKRVEFWTVDEVTDADIYIYDDFDGSAVSNLIASKLDLAFATMGYHSVELDQQVTLAGGDDVYVVLKLRDATFTKPLSYDYKIARTPKTSYISSDGNVWLEFTAGDLGVRLRVSREVDDVPPEIGLKVKPEDACCGAISIDAQFSEEISDTSLHVSVRGEAVAMESVSATHYRGACALEGGGAVEVEARARDLAGNPGSAAQTCQASVVRREAGGSLESEDGALAVAVGPNAFAADSIFMLVTEAGISGEGVLTNYYVYPAGTDDFAAFSDFVEVSIAYDDTVSQPRDLCLARLDPAAAGSWEMLESFVDTTAHRVIAYVDSLGVLGLYRSGEVASDLLHRSGVELAPGYPNPSQGGAEILYEIAEAGFVEITVYSVTGRMVSRVYQGQATRGLHRAQWSGTDSDGNRVASGVYYARIESRGGSASTKLVIVN